jgi:hypothetical protein
MTSLGKRIMEVLSRTPRRPATYDGIGPTRRVLPMGDLRPKSHRKVSEL